MPKLKEKIIYEQTHELDMSLKINLYLQNL